MTQLGWGNQLKGCAQDRFVHLLKESKADLHQTGTLSIKANLELLGGASGQLGWLWRPCFS